MTMLLLANQCVKQCDGSVYNLAQCDQGEICSSSTDYCTKLCKVSVSPYWQ